MGVIVEIQVTNCLTRTSRGASRELDIF